MLAEVDPSIIGWLSHGRGFKIRDQKVFVDTVMQVHFKHTKITSFQRQLNLYGFHRISKVRPVFCSPVTSCLIHAAPWLT